MTFAELATGGDQPKVADLANQLLIIEPTEYKASINTQCMAKQMRSKST